MAFFDDYWEYHKCYEIPRSYALWSGLALISSIMTRKLCYMHGDLEIHSQLYVGLIGPPNQKKSTSCDFARTFFAEACPDLSIGPSRTSPEKVVQLMAQKDFERCFTNWKDEQVPYRPYAFFINEFKNFLGRSPLDMINFLTDIYDRKLYPAATLCRGLEDLINPAVTILMCETPSWFIRNMKGDLITGGIARRFILIYETEGVEPKPFITIPSEAREAQARIRQRLVDIRKLTGLYTWGNARSSYETWYRENHARGQKDTNEVMKGYLGSKNVQLYKVMMLLDIISDKPMFNFNLEHFEMAIAYLDSIEKNMPKLSAAAGRNVMIGPQQKLLELLEQAGGWMPEKRLKKEIETELSPMETLSVFRHLEESEQILKKNLAIPNDQGVKIARWMIILPWKYEKMVANGEINVVKKQQ